MIAYDVGMHNGDDTAYYLAKGFRVVSIEANPAMVAAAKERFAAEIASGRVVIEARGVADRTGELTFYVNPENTVQSSFVLPEGRTWNEVVVPTTALSSLIAQHGTPDLLKIDIESMDLIALRDLQQHSIRPPYISAEAHSFDVLLELHSMGYRRFRLINGKTIAQVFGRMPIRRLDGQVTPFHFRKQCSGPFGNDITTPWLTIEGACQLWLSRLHILGRGWYDIHASLDPGDDGLYMG